MKRAIVMDLFFHLKKYIDEVKYYMFLPRPLKGHERSYGSCKMDGTIILYRAQQTNLNMFKLANEVHVYDIGLFSILFQTVSLDVIRLIHD